MVNFVKQQEYAIWAHSRNFCKISKGEKVGRASSIAPITSPVRLLEALPTFSPFEILQKFQECARIAYFRCISKFTS